MFLWVLVVGTSTDLTLNLLVGHGARVVMCNHLDHLVQPLFALGRTRHCPSWASAIWFAISSGQPWWKRGRKFRPEPVWKHLELGWPRMTSDELEPDVLMEISLGVSDPPTASISFLQVTDGTSLPRSSSRWDRGLQHRSVPSFENRWNLWTFFGCCLEMAELLRLSDLVHSCA